MSSACITFLVGQFPPFPCLTLLSPSPLVALLPWTSSLVVLLPCRILPTSFFPLLACPVHWRCIHLMQLCLYPRSALSRLSVSLVVTLPFASSWLSQCAFLFPFRHLLYRRCQLFFWEPISCPLLHLRYFRFRWRSHLPSAHFICTLCFLPLLIVLEFPGEDHQFVAQRTSH
jgi:hypothetical protein